MRQHWPPISNALLTHDAGTWIRKMKHHFRIADASVKPRVLDAVRSVNDSREVKGGLRGSFEGASGRVSSEIGVSVALLRCHRAHASIHHFLPFASDRLLTAERKGNSRVSRRPARWKSTESAEFKADQQSRAASVKDPAGL